MVDFLLYDPNEKKKVLRPSFKLIKSKDLMIRGGQFYAVWVESENRWSTDISDFYKVVDEELYAKIDSDPKYDGWKIEPMLNSRNGGANAFENYCKLLRGDGYFHQLNPRIRFKGEDVRKDDYNLDVLPYALAPGPTPCWDRMIGTLYDPEERHKIEWCIGAIVTGDSQKIQKAMVIYGDPGAGKSTILDIIRSMFKPYVGTADIGAIGNANSTFALESLRENPIIGINDDADLSRVTDNTRINSLISHEVLPVNCKFASVYHMKFRTFLIMATNKLVKITDSQSGLMRRIIDVYPANRRLDRDEYYDLLDRMPNEFGAIAWRCKEVYESDTRFYDDYKPMRMMRGTNPFNYFMNRSRSVIEQEDGISLAELWEMYQKHNAATDAKNPYSQQALMEEARHYFREFHEYYVRDDGLPIKNYYVGLKRSMFEQNQSTLVTVPKIKLYEIELKEQASVLDTECAACPAQYATKDGIPKIKWDDVTSTLAELDTSKEHYVRVPVNHIVIDFDLKDSNGEKSLEKNLEAANKWPPTYAEVSRGGQGLHLHYYYNSADPENLLRIFDKDIEVKVYTGKQALRRKLTRCNDLPIEEFHGSLPEKEGGNTAELTHLKDEHHLRALINKCLEKEYGATKENMDFINNLVNEAYNAGIVYDISDLRAKIYQFAANSTNQADTCLRIADQLQYASEVSVEIAELDKIAEIKAVEDRKQIAFFDIEVYPNLFLICFRPAQDEETQVMEVVNPTSDQVTRFVNNYRLIGFNNRKYDNHVLYEAMTNSADPAHLYDISQRIIVDGLTFPGAYQLSYADVFDFCAKKQSLKKWEIELGIAHKEMDIPWDKPVPKDRENDVIEYCKNDVRATEALFHHCKADFVAREILADVSGRPINDTTNSHTASIVFDGNRTPQLEFNYRNMGDISKIDHVAEGYDEYTAFDKFGRPIFPGYKFENGVSTYRDEGTFVEAELERAEAKRGIPKTQRREVGEGGYVYAEPGMYTNVALLDISSMHPSSIIAEQLFGERYTKRFQDIRDARVAIKHGDYDTARGMLDGKLEKYLDDKSIADDLAGALKIAINSVYGLTAAKFDNAFKDPRNVDNIVAKRGALFMINLRHEVQKRGFTVAHIKTDSIKIPDATPEIIQFVHDYGKLYGYSFEHEATYERMCLVNDAVYIARYATVDQCKELYGAEYVDSAKDICKDCKKKGGAWTATGKQFQVPYVFKTLFSKEEILAEDYHETFQVSSAMYMDMNEKLGDDTDLQKQRTKLLKADPVDTDAIAQLDIDISRCHDYKFVGKVGRFMPVPPGREGGILVREQADKKTGEKKFVAVTGTKGYRWWSSDKTYYLTDIERYVDKSYYIAKVEEAIATISKYGDFEWFVD